jgi:hypothetical protein
MIAVYLPLFIPFLLAFIASLIVDAIKSGWYSARLFQRWLGTSSHDKDRYL